MKFSFVRTEAQVTAAGDYRFEVISGEAKVSKSGNPMVVIEIKPNGVPFTVTDYIVENEWFNDKMSRFLDSTGINDGENGEFNFLTWKGAMGAARFKKDDEGFLKVSYYLKPERAEKLPEWVGEKPERQTVTELKPNFVEVADEDDLPF